MTEMQTLVGNIKYLLEIETVITTATVRLSIWGGFIAFNKTQNKIHPTWANKHM